jgi:hypothetical protein
VDGFEQSYAYKQPSQFEAAYRLMRDTGPALAADPARYARFTSFGFGLWMDYDWRKNGWSADDPKPNYFQPEELYVSARAALERADEFVWIYSEQPRWWSATGRVKLPSAYENALQRAKRDGAGRARRPR